MPIITETFDKLKPIKFKPDSTGSYFDSVDFQTQQGNILTEYSFLLSANDCNAKNYTINYLTGLFTKDDMLVTTLPANADVIYTSTLSSIGTSGILTFNSALSSVYTDNVFAVTAFSDNFEQKFNLQFLDTGKCLVWTYDGQTKKYLNTVTPLLSAPIGLTESPGDGLEYSLDEGTGYVSFYTTLSSKLFWVGTSSNSLSSYLSYYTPGHISQSRTIFKYTEHVENVESTNNFVFYKPEDSFEKTIDADRSHKNVKNNFLVVGRYEDPTLSGVNIVLPTSILPLKNQISNDNFVNKDLLTKDKQMQRVYTSILTNEYSETDEEKLTLGYNFNTKEYYFLPDKLTEFTTPDTLYPFERININDTRISRAGSYGGRAPIYSDRIYSTQNTDSSQKTGRYVCSWLKDDGVWYDRYQLNEDNEYTQMSSPQVFTFTDEVDVLRSIQNIESIGYYDIRSAVFFTPSTKYKYFRVGKKHIERVLNKVYSDSLMYDTYVTNDYVTKTVVDEDVINFNGSSYSSYNLIDADNGCFNVTFDLTPNSIETLKSHFLVSNIYGTGVGIIKNFIFTPFIYLFKDNSVNVYDLKYNLIKTNVYEFNIKALIYSSQPDNIVLFSDTGYFYETNITGKILKRSEDTIFPAELDALRLPGKYAFTSRIPNVATLYMASSSFPDPDITFSCTVNLDNLTFTQTHFYTGVLSPRAPFTIANTYTTSSFPFSGIMADSFKETNLTVGKHRYNNSIVFASSPAQFEVNLEPNLRYIGLSSAATINDIRVFDEKIFIHQNNKITVINSDREMLSTISLSMSAVSAGKLDLIYDDYTPYIVSFSEGPSGRTVVDKVDPINYRLVESALLPTATDFNAVHQHPTGGFDLYRQFYFYEDKMCLCMFGSDTPVMSGTPAFTWSSNTETYSATPPDNFWDFNYNNGVVANVPTSVVQIIDIDDTSFTSVSLNVDVLHGCIDLYLNGYLKNTITFIPNTLFASDTLSKNITFGMSNYNDSPNFFDAYLENMFPKNGKIENVKLFSGVLTQDNIRYLAHTKQNVLPINVDIPSGVRTGIEVFDNIFRYSKFLGRSNSITINIKNLDINNHDREIIEAALREELVKVLPATVDDLFFNMEIK